MGETLLVLAVEFHAARRFTGLQGLFVCLEDVGLQPGCLVTSGLGGLEGFCQSALDGLEVFELELVVDYLHVAHRVYRGVDVRDVVVVETAQHVKDGVRLTDICEELVAKPLPFRGSLYEAGDVYDLDRGRHNRAGFAHLHKFVETAVRHGYHAHVGLYGAERKVG